MENGHATFMEGQITTWQLMKHMNAASLIIELKTLQAGPHIFG
jgi:hypothetical protein